MNEYMTDYVPTGCDYCGGDKATNLTDMGDVVCDPCLLGRPTPDMINEWADSLMGIISSVDWSRVK